jgi:hypothetical protein
LLSADAILENPKATAARSHTNPKSWDRVIPEDRVGLAEWQRQAGDGRGGEFHRRSSNQALEHPNWVHWKRVGSKTDLGRAF